MSAQTPEESQRIGAPGHVLRHTGVDRAFHWITALATLTLLATGLLPVVGVKFPWITAHWAAGLVLTLAVVFHVLRAPVAQDMRAILISPRDVTAALRALRPGARRARAGKYTLAQKSMHHALGAVVLVAVGTGLPMMLRIDGPFWQRDPYVLSSRTWGVIYVVHGLAALSSLTLVMIHVYFALLPEKRAYLRAMVGGWMPREEAAELHGPDQWPGRKAS